MNSTNSQRKTKKMSAKNRDNKNRWRSITIAFRVTPEENEQINEMVGLAGLTKQEYLTSNMLRHQFVVYPNPRVHKALREYFIALCEELKRLGSASDVSNEYLDVLRFALQIYAGMTEESRSNDT